MPKEKFLENAVDEEVPLNMAEPEIRPELKK